MYQFNIRKKKKKEKRKKRNFDTHEKIAAEDFLPVGLRGRGWVHGCQSHTSNKFKPLRHWRVLFMVVLTRGPS